MQLALSESIIIIEFRELIVPLDMLIGIKKRIVRVYEL